MRHRTRSILDVSIGSMLVTWLMVVGVLVASSCQAPKEQRKLDDINVEHAQLEAEIAAQPGGQPTPEQAGQLAAIEARRTQQIRNLESAQKRDASLFQWSDMLIGGLTTGTPLAALWGMASARMRVKYNAAVAAPAGKTGLETVPA